ncbi:cation:proton antiporter [Kitasatospora sp. NPDC101155]|uniref:cation:proton antiporter n=1 Tax=Kitasatospora sp. NPDC101155 TaxID=3364097 RepID=UPI00381C1D90
MSAPVTVLATPVASIGEHPLLILLLQLAFLMLLALVLGRLATYFKLPAVAGELAAGVLVGPSVLKPLVPSFSAWLLPQQPEQVHLLDAVGQLGVLLLVGVTGSEMNIGLVRKRGIIAGKVGITGLVVPLGLGVATGFLLPHSFVPAGTSQTTFAMFLGVATGVSAIPVIAKTLLDMKLLHRDIGQLILAACVVDDVAGWFLLSVVSAMATAGLTAGVVTTSIVWPVVVVLFAAVIGRPVVGGALRLAGRSESPAPTIATVVVLVMFSSAATQAVHLESIFGAFVCGVLIATSKGWDPRKLEPLRVVVLAFLAPLFFATAGLRMDLTALARPVVLVAALVVLVVAVIGKFVGAFLGAWLSRMNRWEALALGAGMNSRGVVEVIVAMTGLRLHVLDTKTYTIIVLVAIVTSLMAPPILRFAMTRVEETAQAKLLGRAAGPDAELPSPAAGGGVPAQGLDTVGAADQRGD